MANAGSLTASGRYGVDGPATDTFASVAWAPAPAGKTDTPAVENNSNSNKEERTERFPPMTNSFRRSETPDRPRLGGCYAGLSPTQAGQPSSQVRPCREPRSRSSGPAVYRPLQAPKRRRRASLLDRRQPAGLSPVRQSRPACLASHGPV